VTVFTDPDRGCLPRCSESSESPWYLYKGGRISLHVKDMLVVLIDETRAADESMCTYVTDDDESGDWLAAASSASARPVNKSSSCIANEEIALWRMRMQPLSSHKNPLTELRRTSPVVPWIALLGRKVLAVPATSTAPECTPECILSVAGNDQKTGRINLRSS